MKNIDIMKADLISQIDKRLEDKIIEPTNADLLKKLIMNAETSNEAMMIAELGTTYKRTGFHFDKRLERLGSDIKYLKKNECLSFETDKKKLNHKLIIGDNYDALQQLLITHRGMIDVIYIDPPYGCNDMGEFAKTNYTNGITRDNLLSMLYPRLQLAKQLLSDEGVIFCSIDDKNQAYLKGLFDEVFGEENFVGIIIQSKGNAQNDAIDIQRNHEYILTYRKYLNSNNKTPILTNSKIIKKQVYKDDNGHFYYKGSGLVTGGQGSTLNSRKNLGYTIYFNPKTKDKFAIIDYNIDLAKTSNDEDIVYNTNKDLINKGYIAIRPPKKNGKLGAWTWSIEKFNKEKENILITEKMSVIQKIFVDEKDVFNIEGCNYYISETTTKNIKSLYEFSSATGTNQMLDILVSKNFNNPKNIDLIKMLINSYKNKTNAIILDFFAGSGTTGQAVLDLNREDGGKRQFILCTNNEITDMNPNGIAYDVTSKRLKRVMTGECYDGSSDFPWIKSNKAYGDNLDVYEIESVYNAEQGEGKTPFDVIDETCYDMPKFESVQEKIMWVCNNFENTQKYIEEEN